MSIIAMPKPPNTAAMMGETQPDAVVAFAYASLAPDIADRVQTAAHEIHGHVQKTFESTVAIGQQLIAVRKLLPHGAWLPWLAAEFSMSERTARNYIQMAEAEPDLKSAAIADLSPTAMIRLAAAAPATRQAIVTRIQSGERMTAKKIELAIKAAKSPKLHLAASSTPNSLAVDIERALSEHWHQQLNTLARNVELLSARVSEEMAKPARRKDGRTTKEWACSTRGLCRGITEKFEHLTGRRYEHPRKNSEWFGERNLSIPGRVGDLLAIIGDLFDLCDAEGLGKVAPTGEAVAAIRDRFAAARVIAQANPAPEAGAKPQ